MYYEKKLTFKALPSHFSLFLSLAHSFFFFSQTLPSKLANKGFSLVNNPFGYAHRGYRARLIIQMAIWIYVCLYTLTNSQHKKSIKHYISSKSIVSFLSITCIPNFSIKLEKKLLYSYNIEGNSHLLTKTRLCY